jgi:hypothetical protein
MKTGIVILAVLGFTGLIQAQVTATWSINPAKIGEHVDLTIAVQAPAKQINYSPKTTFLACETKTQNQQLWKPGGELEILAFRDTTFTKNKLVFTAYIYTVVAWDSALYRCVDQYLTIQDSNQLLSIPPLAVNFTKKKVKDGIFEIPIHAESDWWIWLRKYWWILVAVVLVVIGTIWWNRNKKIKAIEKLSLRDRTLLTINELKKKSDWKHGRIVNHYLSFSAVLKMYLSSHFELNLMERTTQETTLLLKQKKLNPTALKTISQLLFEADMVKFAQATLPDQQVEEGLDRFIELVNELSPLELPSE